MAKKQPPGDGFKKRRGGNPPKEYQWPPGVSGNPGGRPKKVDTMRERTRTLMMRKIGEEVPPEEMTVADRYLTFLINTSAKNPSAAISFLQWYEGREPPASFVEFAETLEDRPSDSDLEIIQRAFERAMRQKAMVAGRSKRRAADDDD